MYYGEQNERTLLLSEVDATVHGIEAHAKELKVNCIIVCVHTIGKVPKLA